MPTSAVYPERPRQLGPDSSHPPNSASNQNSVLIVDDCESERSLLAEVIQAMDCRVEAAADGQAGVLALETDLHDLVILDLILPDIDGYDLIRHIKSSPRLRHTPVLVVSSLSDIQDRVRALDLGAEDFIIKGFDRAELQARVRRLFRWKRQIDRLNANYAQAVRLAATDDLTGLYNRACLRELLEREISFAREQKQRLALIFADVDHLKQINDRYGHAYADQLLQAVAKAIRDCLDLSATAFRYGGDEFVIVLPHTDSQEACKLADRIRHGVESLRVVLPSGDKEQGPRITLSLGVANFPADGSDPDSLIQCSDKAMYAAKRAGRNTLAVADSMTDT